MKLLRMILPYSILALVLPALIVPCGPNFVKPELTTKLEPASPSLFSSSLSVLLPSFKRRYLIVAYIRLSGSKFLASQASASVSEPHHDNHEGWQKRWATLRQRLGLPAVKIQTYKKVPGSDWEYFYNCQPGSFRKAVQTLKKRIKTFGLRSNEVKQFVTGQDSVYSNCRHQGLTPPALSGSHQDVVRHDRAYHIAAAKFYQADYEKAEKLFLGISRDRQSPYRSWGKYLAARALLRKATLTVSKPDRTALFSRARNLLTKVAQTMKARKADALRLRAWIDFRMNPEARVNQITNSLTGSLPAARQLGHHIKDLVLLLDRFDLEPYEYFGKSPNGFRKYKSLRPRLKTNDLLDFVFNMQARGPWAKEVAISNYKKKRSLPWLVAAISKITVSNPAAAMLMAAAIKETNPQGFLSLRFHRLRLMAELSRLKQMHLELNATLKKANRQNFSDYNLFLALKLRYSTNLDEFASSLIRLTRLNKMHKQNVYFDSDSGQLLSEWYPLSLVETLIARPQFDIYRKIYLARMFWVRAILTRRSAVGLRLAKFLAKNDRQLQQPARLYLQAKGSDHFANLLTLMRYPGLRPLATIGFARHGDLGAIDSFRDNWWCALTPDKSAYNFNHYKMYKDIEMSWIQLYPEGRIVPPPFLAKYSRVMRSERQKLKSLKTAPNYFAEELLGNASYQGRQNFDEALHRIVRASRYGCTDKFTAAYSRTAFRLLHKKFGKTIWAKKTPFWYGNN